MISSSLSLPVLLGWVPNQNLILAIGDCEQVMNHAVLIHVQHLVADFDLIFEACECNAAFSTNYWSHHVPFPKSLPEIAQSSAGSNQAKKHAAIVHTKNGSQAKRKLVRVLDFEHARQKVAKIVATMQLAQNLVPQQPSVKQQELKGKKGNKVCHGRIEMRLTVAVQRAHDGSSVLKLQVFQPQFALSNNNQLANISVFAHHQRLHRRQTQTFQLRLSQPLKAEKAHGHNKLGVYKIFVKRNLKRRKK